MKIKITFFASLLLAALTTSWPASGHHSFGAEFTEEPGEISGVVTRASYRNPHPRYQVEVTNADGSKETWELQAAAVTGLRNAGWDRDFVQVGDVVTVRVPWEEMARKNFLSADLPRPMVILIPSVQLLQLIAIVLMPPMGKITAMPS